MRFLTKKNLIIYIYGIVLDFRFYIISIIFFTILKIIKRDILLKRD